MRKLKCLYIVLLLAVSACAHRTPTPAVDPYHGTPPPTAAATETEDPLHVPVQAPTGADRSFANHIDCDVDGNGTCNAADHPALDRAIRATANAQRPSATPRASVTPRPATQTPASSPTTVWTATPRSTSTATAVATATSAPTSAPTLTPGPTATVPPSEANCLNCVDPKALVMPPSPAPDVHGLACPAWAHDQWIVTGPNGKLYRTWHPMVQPEGMPGAGCNYDHSHGPDDPRKSRANPALPAYGFEADMMGMSEPHQGFKTAWVNAGDCNTLENFCSTSDVKLTVHMGTAGAGRLTVEQHTFAFDMVGQGVNAGAVIHVNGMASTGDPATQCDPAPDTSGPRGFRILAMPKDQALACNIFGPYEVWQFHLIVGGTVIGSKFATFDGITVARRQPNGTFTLEPTDLTWENAPHSGCVTDVYFGGSYLSTNEDFTDLFGHQVIQRGPKGPQIILDTVGKNTYKRPFDGCGPVPYAVN